MQQIFSIIFGDISPIMEFKGDDQLVYDLTMDFTKCFPCFLNREGWCEICHPIRLSQQIRDNIEKLIAKYGEKIKQIYQLRTLLRRYPNDTPFFIVPNDIHNEESQRLQGYLLSLDKPDPEKSLAELEGVKNQIQSNYRMLQQPGIKKVRIGEPDKTKRVCRYCNRSMPEVTFKDEAHTISESLGNKLIFTNTECDVCNNKFGTGIEHDVANFHYFERAFYQIPGKEKLKFGSTNYTIEHPAEKQIKIGITLTDEQQQQVEKIEKETGEIHLPFDSGQTYIPRNIYKALCKFVIGIIPDEEVSDYRYAIDWVNDNFEIPVVPPVLYNFPTFFRLKNPRITLLRKISADSTLPNFIGIVEFSDTAYAFVVPSDNDTINYTDTELWIKISEKVQIYEPKHGWRKIYLSSTEPLRTKINLRFTKN